MEIHIEDLDRHFENFSRKVDHFMDDIFGSKGSGLLIGKPRVHKDKDSVTIEIDVPGAKPEDVAVSSEHGILEVKWTRESHGKKFEGHQSFSISKNADIANIKASVAHGMLTLVIPSVTSESKSVSIKVNG
jgi:HSP20 family molecular chaperone IbpA